MKTLSFSLILVLFLNVILTLPSYADSPWSPSIKVSGSNFLNFETTIAVFYPNIYVSYMSYQKLRRSTDGGITWLMETNVPSNSNNVSGDGSMYTDEVGNLHMSYIRNSGTFWRAYYCHSTTQGSNWETPVLLSQVTEIADKCWLFNRNNRVYVTFMAFSGQESNVKLVKSVDRGMTFSQGIVVNDGNRETFRLFPIVREDPKDSNIVYISTYWDTRNFGTDYVPPWQMFVAKSTDGGSSWLPNVALPDTGKTTLFPGDLPYSMTSSMAVSPLYNDVYCVWGDSLPGGKPNIFFSRSTNGAASFEPRVKIPDGPVPDTAYHWQPWIECDMYGTIHIIWYDTRGFASNHLGGKKATYYTYSTNRGDTWAPNEKVSDSSDVFGNTFGIGHYQSFTTDSYRIYSTWTEFKDAGNGSDVYFSWRYLPNVIGVQHNNNNLPEAFRLEQNYPNPFNPSTTITFEMPNSANVKLTIYDAAGKEIKVLLNGIQSAGMHEVAWDASEYPSGIYFYKLESDSYLETKKMVVIK